MNNFADLAGTHILEVAERGHDIEHRAGREPSVAAGPHTSVRNTLRFNTMSLPSAPTTAGSAVYSYPPVSQPTGPTITPASGQPQLNPGTLPREAAVQFNASKYLTCRNIGAASGITMMLGGLGTGALAFARDNLKLWPAAGSLMVAGGAVALASACMGKRSSSQASLAETGLATHRG